MKKSLMWVLTLVILLLPAVLAIETTIKEKYQPGETLIAEISGNFIDNLKASDILFYAGRAFTPLIDDLFKMQGKYYLYALLPYEERNYTLIIKNAHYFEGEQEKKEDLKFNFLVEGEPALFTVNPGFVITNKDFNIKVKSNFKTIDLQAEFLNSTKQISLGEGKTKTLSFSVSGINKFILTSLILTAEDTKYEIPVAIFPAETLLVTKQELRFSKSYLNFTVLKNQEFDFPLALINTGQENITDIELQYSELENIITIKPESINIEANSMKELKVTINSQEEGFRKGKIRAVSENYASEVLLSITTTISEEQFQEFVQESELIEEETCAEMNGDFCEDDEECGGITKLDIDGKLCCLGTCEKEEKGSGKTIALVIIIILLLVIIFFVYKKLKVKKKSHKEILKEKSKSYEERFEPKPEEVRGSLSKS